MQDLPIDPMDLDFIKRVSRSFLQLIISFDYSGNRVDCFCLTLMVRCPSQNLYAVTIYQDGKGMEHAEIKTELLFSPNKKNNKDGIDLFSGI